MFLFLDPFALLYLGREGLDLRWLALLAALHVLLDDRLARLQCLLPLAAVPDPVEGGDEPALQAPVEPQAPAPEALAQLQPAEVGKNGHAEQEYSEQDQPAADGTEGCGKGIADRLAENAAGTLGQAGIAAVIHRGQRRSGDHHQHQAQAANAEGDPVKGLVAVTLTEDDQGAVGQQQRKQVRRVTHQREGDVRDPGASGTAGVGDTGADAGRRPARVLGAVGGQRQQQVQADGANGNKSPLAQSRAQYSVVAGFFRHALLSPCARWRKASAAQITSAIVTYFMMIFKSL